MDRPTSEATNALIEEHLKLVPAIAQQLFRDVGHWGMSREDLEAAGSEGLVVAAQRFDASREVPFRRYASLRVRGAMIDALRRNGTLPRQASERLLALSGALEVSEAGSEELTAPLAPGATARTLDARLAEQLARTATAIATGLLARVVDDGEEIIAVENRPDPEESLSREQFRGLLRDAIASELTDQERVIIEQHYFEGRRFDHIAADLGLSKSWLSRIHSRALAKMNVRISSA